MEQRKGGYSEEVKLKVADFIADTSDEKMLELTAIKQNDSMSLACMIASNELRDRLVAVTDIEILEHNGEEVSEELRKKAKPFFLNRRIIQIYFKLQRSVDGHSLQEWFKIMQTQEESAIEDSVLDDADRNIFGNV